MRAVVQRVSSASVETEGIITGRIGKGLLVFLGVEEKDTQEDIKYLSEKICGLRIFEDQNEKMNLSLKDVGGELLVVSQFTLYGDCRKGKRPSFIMAARPQYAQEMYEKFIAECENYVGRVETGKFQADMKVELVNDGPVTILIDSKKNF